MKALCWFLILVASASSVAIAQPVGKTVKLVGIVSLDVNCAIVEVTQTNYTSNHHAREHTEQFMLGKNQTESGVQVQSIDAAKGAIAAKVDGETRTFTFDSPKSAKMMEKSSTIQLRGVKLQRVIYLYGELKGRTVLQHPGLKDTGFTLTANPQSRPAAAKALEELFASHEIAAIPDGEKFVLLVPCAFTNKVSPRSKDIADNGPTVPALSVNLQGVPMSKVLEIYGEYNGHPVNNLQSSPFGLIHLVQENPLSKDQICYAMETMFAWNGVRVIPNNDKTSNWERIPQ